KILLYHRSENSRYKPNEFGLVAGNVEENESCIQAIIREANEEVGIVICENDLEISFYFCIDKKIMKKVLIYSTKQQIGKVKLTIMNLKNAKNLLGTQYLNCQLIQ
ncbi:MAG: NUDIX hydrolase, partial [Saprospiraceae bacterium]|nr:NUDIX hydrolase [Saprospiraceae bacterium]